MKRCSRLFAVVLLLLTLCACGKEKTEFVYYYGEGSDIKAYTINREEQTIAVDGHVCQYDDDTITYPDGSQFWRNTDESATRYSWSDDYDPKRYARGETLLGVLSEVRDGSAERERTGNPLFGVVLLLIGIFNAAVPQAAWDLSVGWKFKDAEPSDSALYLTRAGGIAAILIGAILIFI